MKNLLTLVAACALTFSVSAQGQLDFDTTHIVLDTIITGTDFQQEFTFTNTGDKPLTIRNVSAVQAGSKVMWTKGAIQPGKTGKVTVDFSQTSNTKGQKKLSWKVYSTAKNKVVALHLESFYKAANPTY